MHYRLFGLAILTTGALAQAPVSDVSDATIEQRLATLERMVATRTNNQHSIQGQLDLLQDEVNQLRGSIEEHNYQLEKILERQRELYLEIDKRIESLQNTPVRPPPEGQVTAPVGIQQPVVTVSENDAYEKAVNLILREKQYDQAIPAFQSFLQQFPNSGYTANAHYWLGQLLFNKQDWAAAAEQFKAVVDNFADSSKRPDAILKLGIAESKRGNNARAKQLLNQVIAEYPDASASKLAKNQLQALN